MRLNTFDIQKPVSEIKDELGWWEHGQGEEFKQLVKATMMLCDRIRLLENEINQLKQTANKAANDANCLANGIIPD